MEYYLLKKIQNYLQVNNLDAMIIPSTDPHMSEYVAESFQFRKVVSGFTGSAGTLVVGKKESALWTDSRYYLQAEIELQDSGILLMRDGEEQTPSVAEWIFSQKTETKELLVGYDFSFISVDWEKKFVAEITHLGGICNRFNVDYDEFWIDRPLMPSGEIWIYEEKFVGESVGKKIERLRKLMIEKSKRTDSYTIVSKLDEIAWLLNLRGSDVAYTPVFYAYLLVFQKQVVLYVDEQKLSSKVKAYLEENNIEIKQYFKNCVLQEIEKEDLYLCYDSKVLSVAIFSLIKKVGYEGLSLVGEMKAIKNETEIRNLRLAMKKDAKAIMDFEKWL
ncbi:MAG: aminopeptidase P family N-terminal domain-containing protein, partial [Paludibacteraceae bacterium]|nr:aminopeptidase P family N-terminal domain-containing protein [Paludibacteraceae bacterium]